MQDFDLQQQLAEQRRQRYAGQSQFQAPQGQMIGRHFVAPNALQYLASGLRSLGGMRGEQLAEQEIGQIKQQKAEGTQKALADFLRQSQGASENAPADGMGPVMPAVAPNMQGAYAALMQAPDASLRNMGMQGMIQMPELQAKQAERVADREFRQQQLQEQFAQRIELMREQNATRQEMAQAQRDFQREMAAQGLAARREMAGIVGSGANKAPAGYRFKQDGALEPIPGGPADTGGVAGGKPLTESQAKGSLYLGQMRSATENLGELGSVSPVTTAMAGNTLTNWMAPAKSQQVAQLQNQWAEAYLRAKTGAAATASEVDLNRRTFFPVTGDSPSVIAQKERMRLQAERDMEPTAGPGAARAGQAPVTAPKAEPKPRMKFDAQGNPVQ